MSITEFAEDREDPCNYELSSHSPESTLLGFGAKQWWWSYNSCDQVSEQFLYEENNSVDVHPIIAALIKAVCGI